MFRWLRYPKVYVEFSACVGKMIELEPSEYGVGLPLPIAERYTIRPLELVYIYTGIKIAMTPRYYAMILPMPLSLYRHNLSVLPNTIEPDDDSQVIIPVFNLSKTVEAVLTPSTLPIAQLVIARRRVFNIVSVPSIKNIQEWLGIRKR